MKNDSKWTTGRERFSPSEDEATGCNRCPVKWEERESDWSITITIVTFLINEINLEMEHRFQGLIIQQKREGKSSAFS